LHFTFVIVQIGLLASVKSQSQSKQSSCFYRGTFVNIRNSAFSQTFALRYFCKNGEVSQLSNLDPCRWCKTSTLLHAPVLCLS